MKHLALTAFAALTLLSTPVAAESLSILLPQITFPEPVVTPSTKACDPVALLVCQLEE